MLKSARTNDSVRMEIEWSVGTFCEFDVIPTPLYTLVSDQNDEVSTYPFESTFLLEIVNRMKVLLPTCKPNERILHEHLVEMVLKRTPCPRPTP